MSAISRNVSPRNYLFFFLFAFLGIQFTAFSQETDGAQLIKQLQSASEDSTKARLYTQLSHYYCDYETVTQGDSSADLAVKYALLSKNDALIGDAYVAKGQALDYTGDYAGAIEKYQEGIDRIDTSANPAQYGTLLQAIGNAYYFEAALVTAQAYYYHSMKIRESVGDSVGMAGSMMGMANVCSDNQQEKTSIGLYKNALGIEERFHKQKMASWLLNNIGSMYVNLNNLDSALYFFERSIEIKKEMKDEYGLSTTYNNIAEIYLIRKDPRAALFYFRQGYEFRRGKDNAHEIAGSYYNIARVYLDLGVNDSALLWADSAIVLSEKTNTREILYKSLFTKAQILSQLGEFEEASKTLFRSYALRDSVMTSESSEQVNDLMQKYGSEQQQHHIEIQNVQIESDHTFRKFLYVVIALAVALGFVLLIGFIRKQKNNRLLGAKNDQIRRQKQIVEEKSRLVEEKNKDIIDSITYAKRIQSALLPAEARRLRLLPESFVFYKPRDIVSGDFYLMEEWGKEIIAAAVDCTGHGVPGAFMSFLAYNLFQEAVMEHGITSPEAILARMRSGVMRMLGRENESVYDGMDAAICTISSDRKTLTYSGAHRPLWLIRNGALIEYKETKCSVSASEYDQLNFIAHEIPVQPGDAFYIFSDGYADQFGGPQGKKFKVARLKQLLLDFHRATMNVQEEKVAGAFAAWKHAMEQVDDVLVIGFRIPDN